MFQSALLQPVPSETHLRNPLPSGFNLEVYRTIGESVGPNLNSGVGGNIVHKVMDVPTSKLPDLVILVTDGGTDWPDRDKTKTPFISCVTRPESIDPLWKPCPDWMSLVYMVD